ncbi:lactonase family protein [Pelomonas sp. KK5]|uniref:lactonase family protein n=1 Tax=Pelomonas sp. KK5 TaxID=1855730 RepID=UPI0009F9A768|nr:lactonase family protein [Pelomonas sp. KK5]
MRMFWMAALLLSLGACATREDVPVACGKAFAFIGSDGPQLRKLDFDGCSGQLSASLPVADVPKSRWLVAHPTLARVYVAEDGSGKDGSVAAFALDRRTGALSPINTANAGGGGTTFLALDKPSSTLLAANFTSGSAASLTIKPDGSLGATPASTIKATGSGPHRRQAGPHAHGISIDPSGRYALVADMGADRVFVYGFDRATHALSASGDTAFATPPGSGPRRAVFGASGRFVYVLNELSAEVMVLRWDAPTLSPVQTLAISSEGFKGARSAAEIAVSRDGRFVYIADRGEATLLVYAVNQGTGELSLLQRLPAGGDGPWAFDISPEGRWLLLANFRSNRVNLFAIDPASGRLGDTGQSVETPGPVSVTFVTMKQEQ